MSLSETLACELAAIESKIKVSVLCPAGVKTNIMDSERIRPDALKNESVTESTIAVTKEVTEMLRQLVEDGLPPSQVADAVFDAVRNEKFYILTHQDWKPLVEKRMEDILRERNPYEASI